MKKVKILSFVLSVCMIVSLLGICASAEETTAQSRALILGAPDPEETFVLNDVAAMDYMFNKNNVDTTVYINNAASTAALKNAISNFASTVNSKVVNYVYISSHGGDGDIELNGREGSPEKITYSDLRQMLNVIDGKIVLMIDACHSGSAISKDDDVDTIEEGMINSFWDGLETETASLTDSYDTQSTFDGKSKYIVFCASFAAEKSGARYTSYATDAWSRACEFGVNSYGADANSDLILTAKELNDYAVEYIKTKHADVVQHPCYYSYYFFDSVFFQDYILGDINQDGSINMKDDLVLRKYIAGSVTLTERQVQLADLNQDGSVNMKDELVMRKYIAGQSVTE